MTIHNGPMPPSVRREEIKAATKLIIRALGCDLEKARVNDADLPYTRLLESLSSEGMSDASKAHQAFYGVVDSLCSNPESTWKSGFHPFTTIS